MTNQLRVSLNPEGGPELFACETMVSILAQFEGMYWVDDFDINLLLEHKSLQFPECLSIFVSDMGSYAVGPFCDVTVSRGYQGRANLTYRLRVSTKALDAVFEIPAHINSIADLAVRGRMFSAEQSHPLDHDKRLDLTFQCRGRSIKNELLSSGRSLRRIVNKVNKNSLNSVKDAFHRYSRKHLS